MNDASAVRRSECFFLAETSELEDVLSDDLRARVK
jgi:hypothetical protein